MVSDSFPPAIPEHPLTTLMIGPYMIVTRFGTDERLYLSVFDNGVLIGSFHNITVAPAATVILPDGTRLTASYIRSGAPLIQREDAAGNLESFSLRPAEAGGSNEQ